MTERLTIGTHINISEEELNLLYPEDGAAMFAARKLIAEKLQARETIRGVIKRDVGDTASLLGTTADGSQLSVAVHMALISALNGNTTFANFKTQFFGTLTALVGSDHETGDSVDVPAMANDFLAALTSGDIVLTAAVKGVPAVISEIGERSTGVAEILIAAAQASAQQSNS